jgi:ribosome maturation factor RimP
LLLAGHLPILEHLAVEIARLTGLFFLESGEMAEFKEKMQVLLAPILDAHAAFLVDVAVRNERGGKLVQAFVDTDSGVTIEECAEISRELAQVLNRENLIQSSYRLEVSSPGIDKPLKMLRQYRKNVGRRFKVVHQTTEAKATLVGKLEEVGEGKLTFKTDGGEMVTLDFTQIVESKEELPW